MGDQKCILAKIKLENTNKIQQKRCPHGEYHGSSNNSTCIVLFILKLEMLTLLACGGLSET